MEEEEKEVGGLGGSGCGGGSTGGLSGLGGANDALYLSIIYLAKPIFAHAVTGRSRRRRRRVKRGWRWGWGQHRRPQRLRGGIQCNAICLLSFYLSRSLHMLLQGGGGGGGGGGLSGGGCGGSTGGLSGLGGANDGGVSALCASLGRTLRYSSGSLALGSLLVIPGRLLRFFLEHCLHQVHKQTEKRVNPGPQSYSNANYQCSSI